MQSLQSIKDKLKENIDISLDLIETNLWLGKSVVRSFLHPTSWLLGNVSAATDVQTLTSKKISHILSLDSCPLPRHISEMPTIKNEFIQIADLPKEDILGYLEGTFNFIEEGISKGGVLVHCYFGMSRSASFVIAYLMKKYSISYDEAFQRVKGKRSVIFPNEGFVKQLRLYEEMGNEINKSNPKYRQYRLKQAANIVRKVKILPHNFVDLIKPDPGLNQVSPESRVFRCKKCRRVVASESNVIVHTKKPDVEVVVKDENGDVVKEKCSETYFIEPIAWMKSVHQIVQGKLNCPKCSSKLGSFSWIMGCQCPCGTKVAPAFYLIPSKVDWSDVVQNVQITV